MTSLSTDILIVGSGPIGSTYARQLSDRDSRVRITMVDAGPQLTDSPGVHVRNIADEPARRRARLSSQGPPVGSPLRRRLARPGTFLLYSEESEVSKEAGLPAAALSSNIGGMGAHWLCASPRPDVEERIPWIPATEWESALTAAEALLSVTVDRCKSTARESVILRTVAGAFDSLPAGRNVQLMPLACATLDDGTRYWTGTDVILGRLAEDESDRFALLPQTLCRELVVEDTMVRGAILEDLLSGARSAIRAKVVVVACDALRTPQLLWASKIRPPGLGRYLNVPALVVCRAQLADETARASVKRSGGMSRDPSDPTTSMLWIPFSKMHRFHGQIMIFEGSSAYPTRAAPDSSVSLNWFVPKETRFQDCVRFSDRATDSYGMPRIITSYGLTSSDRHRIEAARGIQTRVAQSLGGLIAGAKPAVLPAGSSLHYLGTARMGDAIDKESVCDSYCRVWGMRNLFVGGNCVIPTKMATSPTLTSVALALRACDGVLDALRPARN